MKIIHVVWSFTVGGTESMLIDIANIQIRMGHQVSIIIINDMVDVQNIERLDKRCTLYYCHRKKNSKSPLPLLKLNWLLFKLRPDVVHAHMERLGKYIVRLFMNFALVRTVHSTMGNVKEFNKYDAVYSISRAVQRYLSNKGYESEIVFNGINIDKIKTCRENPFDSNICRIISVGRLEKVKGHQVLIKAAHYMKELGADNFTIDIIGEGNDRNKLEELISTYSLSDTIHLLGLKSRDYIYNHLCEYDIFVLPSLSEGFGLTLAEAMAAKVPVLTCDLEGPMEVIDYGKYGRYFPCGNSKELAVALLEMIKDKERGTNTEKAFAFVCQNFDVRKTTQNYCDKYNEIIGS